MRSRSVRDRVLRIMISAMFAVLLVPVASTMAVASLKPKYGGTLVVAGGFGDPRTMNPNVVLDTTVYYTCYAGFFNRLTATDEHSGEIHPDLADSWEMSDDAKTVTYKLNPKAKWHDGKRATSADVKWTFEKIITSKSWQAPTLADVSSIETPNNETVTFKLSKPNAAFITNIGTIMGIAILPKHLYEGTDWTTNPYNDKPIGTGPFKFVEWKKGSHVLLEANPDYHRGRPYLDKIIIRNMQDQAVIQAAFEAKELNHVRQIPLGEWERVSKIKGIRVEFETGFIPTWLGFNLRRKPLDNVRVREALSMLVDKKDISRRVYYGFSPPCNGTFMSTSWAYNPNVKLPAHDPASAEKLLDELGFPKKADGTRFSIGITTEFAWGFPGVCDVLKENFRKAGIDLKIELMEWGAITEKVLNKFDFDLCILGGTHGPDPVENEKFLVTGHLRNSVGYSNAKVDELFSLGRSTGNREQRKKYYWEIQEIVAKDLPRFIIVEQTRAGAWWSDWHGFFGDKDFPGQSPDECIRRFVWWDGGTELTTATTSVRPTTVTTPAAAPAGPDMTIAAVALVIVVVVAVMALRRRKSAT